MAKIWYPIAACLNKANAMNEKDDAVTNSDKVTDKKNEPSNEAPSGGMIWKVSSGLYNIGSGAVGLGVGSVKWAASTTYNIGSGVVSATQNVVSKVVPVKTPKPKNE